MASCHQGMIGGHRVFRWTLDQVCRRGLWLGWRLDVQRFCRQCPNCTSYHQGQLPHFGPLQPMFTGSLIWERCHVDNTGLHPQTPQGSKYILTCVDAFSKWAEAFVLQYREARLVTWVLVEQVFWWLWPPVALLTCWRTMDAWCKRYVSSKKSTSSKQVSNGQRLIPVQKGSMWPWR